ncbi:MAG: sugar phosphate nucleotidyltransferase [Bacillota bacterium]|nr:sugar phosphate nucleotidyltransferase [Bacillota bacterium]
MLLSGGSGKRLWPLSNDSRSKQFLKLLPSDQKSNQPISMLQRIWRQLQRVNLAESTIVSTSNSQIDMLHSQIGTSVPLVLEPFRRDTFPAVALSSIYLYSMKDVKQEEIVVVMPVDSYVEDDFFHYVKSLEKVVQDSKADLSLIGIKPTFPSEKYGYIVPSDFTEAKQEKIFQPVQYFKEKPTVEQAKQLILEGGLWNSGVFAFKLAFIINSLKERGLPLNYNDLVKTYERLPARSFDYEVVEKTKRIVVTAYHGEWKDLGTWNTLTEEMGASLIGKGTMSPDCENVHIVNELDIPVSVIGLSNLIVAVSPNGILVSDKKESSRVKEIANQFDNRSEDMEAHCNRTAERKEGKEND